MGRRARHGAVPALVLALLVAGPAANVWAQAQDSAGQDAKKPTIEDLEKRLDERDAVIRQLLIRLVQLERRVAQIAPPRPVAQAAPPSSASPAPPPHAEARAAGATQGTPTATQPAGESSSAPGQFQVDPEAAQRALERALVQTGALLLPPGTAQIVPSLTYVRREAAMPSQLVLTTDGHVLISDAAIQQDQIEAAVLFRTGLPWDMQLDVNVPYDFVGNSNATSVSGVGLTEHTNSQWLLGQPGLTLHKLLLDEGEWTPNLIANVGWISNIGRTSGSAVIGEGFNQITAGFTASKRQDPLVFTASLGYDHSFEETGVEPGDQYSASAGVLFAVSPETSLSLGPQLTFQNKTVVNGLRIPGSQGVSSLFEAGLFTNLAPGIALDFISGIGAGNRSPKYVFQIALPIQFGLGF